MPTRLTTSSPSNQLDPWDGPKITLALGALVGFVTFVAAAWSLPGPIVLPLFSIVAIAGATITATLGWWTSQRFTAHGLSYWDVAGAMTLIGVCAALLSDPEQAIPLLEARQNK
ncbi:MAG: hypothetical protein EOP21_13525 [Hyphomicrobiales bacterium]|nr:MAG: hypothetical protein EOP21_13525 [Hyphomicrobiales bacterium]